MFEEPIRFFVDVVQRERLGARFSLRRAHVRERGPRQALRHAGCRLGADEWVRVDDARTYRPRRAVADGGVPDQERARPAHQPGQARLLGRPPPARRAHPAAAAERARAARPTKRSSGPDAPRDARPAPRPTPRAPAATSGSTRSAWSSKATARSASAATQDLGGPAGRYRAPRSPTAARGPVSTACATYHARTSGRTNFVDNLCRKLLAYALGRSLLLSDEPLVAEMRQKLAADDYRFGALVETIVTSPQFLNKRSRRRRR